MGNGTNGDADDETNGGAHDETDGDRRDGPNDGPRAGTKERRTYYTDDRVAAARANVERYDWAAERAESAISRADGVVAEGLEALWEAVPGQRIPRAGLVGDGNGRETWKPIEGRPWKITDGDVVLPTNDFAAYRESGRDDRGFFDPALADDSLLVNEEYPDRPDDWGVDDGTGWRDADGDVADPGTVLVPVAFYAHFYRWYELWDDLEALRDAFCYTGEDRYGRAGCVLLDRIADAYPRMDVGAYPSERFWNSHGGTGAGKVVGSIWETNLVRNLVSSYDALFPAFADTEVVEILAEKRAAYPALSENRSPAAIRGNVERGIVREVLPAVEGAQIRGNLGMHQAALAMAAVVMDEPDGYTGEAIDFLFRPGALRTVEGEGFREVERERETTDCEWELTGGELGPALVEKLDRDGYGYEAAPNYNLLIRNQLARVADVLERYDPPEGRDGSPADRRFDLYDHPKLRPAMAAYYPLVLLDRYLPSIGDSGLTGNPERKVTAERAVRSFEIYDDPTFAQVAHLLNGEPVDGLEGDLFSPDADAVPDRIADAVAERGRYAPGSVLEPSYGFAALRQGSRGDDAAVTGDGSAGMDEKRDEDAAETDADRDGDTRRAITLYFGRNAAETGSSHCHMDALDLGIYAHDLALAPDLGYPEHTGDWPKRRWTSSTVAHNAVVVDEGDQHPIRVGDPLLFDDAEFVSVVDVDAPGAYPRTDEYRRTTVQVAVDDAASYVADVFRVTGGDDHLFSFHGAEGGVSLEGLAPSPREGTLAGPDVQFPEHGEETAHNREVGNGFDYLRNLTRDDDPPDRFAVDWDVADAWDVCDDDRDVHLRLTMLGDVDSVALADGEPPQKGGNPESLRYLLARRTGADEGPDLQSAFRSVLEPYVDEPRVVDVAEPELAVAGSETGGDEGDGDHDVRAIRVELDTGRTDWIVAAGTSDAEYAVDGRFRARGSLAFYAERDGAPARAYLADGTHLRSLASGETLCERETPTHLEGRVVDFTRDLAAENEIVLECEGSVDLEGAVGRHLHVATPERDRPGDNGVYEIAGLERDGDRVIVDVGDATTVEGFADPADPDAGYEHVVAVGATACVPAAERWTVDE